MVLFVEAVKCTRHKEEEGLPLAGRDYLYLCQDAVFQELMVTTNR